jgi:hypothetical protein
MKMTKLMAASAAICALAIGAPAMAQQSQDNDAGPTNGAAGDNSDTIVVNDLLDVFLQAQSSSEDDNSTTINDVNSNNTSVSARQSLSAINTNQYLDEVADFDGEDDTQSTAGYNSGGNSVSGSAFAAFAGILNQSWNTGLNSNAQSATNVAVQGTINFNEAGDGGGSGGD